MKIYITKHSEELLNLKDLYNYVVMFTINGVGFFGYISKIEVSYMSEEKEVSIEIFQDNSLKSYCNGYNKVTEVEGITYFYNFAIPIELKIHRRNNENKLK